MFATLKRFIPLLDALQGYQKADFRGDLAAGLTVAVMLIPQGMAYAMLAGLPPIVGLYASTIPLAVYALFGTSRQLAVGPVAMMSLMVAAGVGTLAQPGSGESVAYAVLLAGIVGIIQLVMGLGRLGFVVNFLSHPVVSGFTSAAALIIGFSQLKHLLGINLPSSHHVHTILLSAGQRIGETNLVTFALGAASIVVLLLLKKWRPSFPGALLVVVLGTVAVALLGLKQQGVAIVGDVPSGLPTPTLPTLDLEAIKRLAPVALAISLVGFMESISVAKAFARKNRYEVNANKELVGLGLANLAGSLMQGYPVTGGFSRTAVNGQAGARTGVASLITAAVIALTLVLLTPLFYYLPQAVLAAIIMVAVFGLVDIREVKHLYKVKRGDLALLLITFAGTLLLGIEEGILIGVGASLVAVIYRTTRPHTAVLGRMPNSHVFRNVERHPEAITYDGILVLRIDAQFYFGNVTFLKDTVKRLVRTNPTKVSAIVLDAATINHLDSSADAALHDLVGELRDQNIQLFIANVRGPVLDIMQRSGFDKVLGREHFTLSVLRAVQLARQHVASRPSSAEHAVDGSSETEPGEPDDRTAGDLAYASGRG